MTMVSMPLEELLEKGADADSVCEMIAFVALRLMEADVEGLCWADYRAQSEERDDYRNCHPERRWDTRAESMWLKTAKRHQGRYKRLAVGVNGGGRLEILSLAVELSETETFWTPFLCELTRRGLSRGKPITSDARVGFKAVNRKVL